jgi:hypothetical protein
MMSDDEYRAFLDALARKYLRLHRIHRHHLMEDDHLRYELERAASLGRLVHVAEDRPEDARILSALGQGLRETYLSGVVDALDESGVLRAIEEDRETIFANLRRSVIPDEDLALLRQSGILDPDAEITLLIHYARQHLGRPSYDAHPSDAVKEVPTLVQEAGQRLEQYAGPPKAAAPEKQPEKKRKIFNGVGKILSGAVTGIGNLLLGAGGIVAPNPATAYAVIGSSALAVSAICQGVGDLRGE